MAIIKGKNPNELIENEYKSLSEEAIDLHNKGQKLSPEKQVRYDFVKEQMSNIAKGRPVKFMSEEEALTPTPEEKAQFKTGQHNLKDEWNKQLDALEKSKPDKKSTIDKMRNYDDEAIELTRAFIDMMGGKW